MDPFKAFNTIFLSSYLATVALIVGVYLYMQPLVGELTRLGGYLENHFGWRAPQEHFREPLFTVATGIEDYDRPYDVVVIGDSFSDDLSKGWQNYLAAATGWSIISFNMNQIDPEAVLGSRMYRTAAPQLLIYQSVERNLIDRFDECPATAPGRTPASAPIAARPIPADIEMVGMDHYPRAPVNGMGIDSAFNFLQKAVNRRILKRNTTEVYEFKLVRGDLFSNAASDRLLVITRDFKLRRAKHQDIETAKCGMLDFQRRIERSGRTAFVGMLFPDKSTVYSAYIDHARYRDVSVIDQFEQEPTLHVTQLDQRFRSAVANGVVDLYLPNDTHCGYVGYRIAADAVLDVLRRRELIDRLNGRWLDASASE
jgi:hypothetical protein